MDVDFSDLRRRRTEADIEAKEIEATFGRLKIEELERKLKVERASPAEDHILTFSAPIDADTVGQAIRTLDMWSRSAPGCDLTIVLNSPGGEVLAGFALHDFIELLKEKGHKVNVKVLGSAMSMAAAVLQAASERYMTPNSWLLIHEVSSEIAGNATQLEEKHAMVRRWQEKILNILAARSGMTHDEIKSQWKNKDWMLDAEEAKALGFVDTIG